MESRPESPRRHIIVIDHDDDSRLILSDQLQAMGFEVHAEDNSVSGLARIACELPQAPSLGLIVELNMPGLGGMAIIQEVRDRYPDMPVIAMSHVDGITRLRHAIQLGAQEYLVKPFSPELFKRKCRQVFQPTRGLT